MIKPILFLLLFCISPSSWVYAHHHSTPEGHVHLFGELDLRYLKKMEDFRWISEFRARNSFDNRVYSHIKLGLNYRLASFLKLGFHYRAQKNHRNNDNWIKVGTDWEWNEDENGIESILIPEAIFRFMLASTLRAELRLHYEWNTRNQQETLRLRPNFTYFWIRNGEHFANIYLQYEHFMPIDFGNRGVSQRWTYLGFLYSLDSSNKLGMNIAHVEWLWTESPMFIRDFPGQSYVISDKAWLIGLTYIFSD